MELLRGHADLSLPLSVLDVGAGRGKFVRAFLSTAPSASVTAVEPDQRQAWACAFLNRSKIISKRIEETCFPDEHFDIVRSLPIRLTPMTATFRVPPLSRVKLGIGWSRGVARDAEQ